MTKLVSAAAVQSHQTRESCWIVVEGRIYDMTSFSPTHPGGADIIYAYAGRDATQAYLEVHEPDLIKSTLSPKDHIGTLDPATALPDEPPSKPEPQRSEKPPLETFINLYDFEEAAKNSFSKKSWSFISGASNDNITRDVSFLSLTPS
jgi:L-lactate dehydrogenase (cytochrome)